jgi:diketogulonate reductase-like aldo/keto reductase
MPVLGFGTLIPDAAATMSATRDALEAGFRHFDCAERYRNEREVGNVSALPEDALDEINRIPTRQRLNQVVKTVVPGFIPRARST